MSGLIKKAILHRRITLFIMLVLIGAGVYNYFVSPRQETPEIVAPVALISVVYPGATPQDVESLVTSKIEGEIRQIEGYDYSYSYSKDSIAIVILRLSYETDIKEAWATLRQTMSDLQGDLPGGCSAIEVNTDLTDTAGLMISMSSDIYNYDQLVEYAKTIQEGLASLQGLSRFDIIGEQKKILSVTMNEEQFSNYHLSYQNVIDLIRAQNIEIPSGDIGEGRSSVKVRVEGFFQDKNDLQETIIAVSEDDGSIVHLKDVAKVDYVLDENNEKIIHDGKTAILLVGYFNSNENIVSVGDDVSRLIDQYKEALPEGIEFTNILDQPATVDAAISDFIDNLIQGVFFVIVVVFVGMGIRNAVIVSTAIPASILMTFAAMRIFHIQVHQISIAALIVALGMLVDNAIVVSDAIQVRLDHHEKRLDACINGVKEVAIPVLTSTLTTIAAFLPLLLLNSIAGEYISSLPKIVMIALILSYGIAIFITPTMAYIFFKERKDEQRKHHIRKLFTRLLRGGMKARPLVVFLMLLLISSTVYLGLGLGLQFFPFAETNMFYIDIKSEQAANLSATEALVDEVIQVVDEESLIEHYTVAIGDGLPKFYQTMPIPTPSKDYAQMMVIVDKKQIGRNKKYPTMTAYINALQLKMDQHLYSGTAVVKELEQGEPVGAPVVVRLSGNDLDSLGQYAKEVVSVMESIPGAVNIRSDYDDYRYDFFVDLDETQLGRYGLTKYDVQNEISIALYGREAGVLHHDGMTSDVLIKSDIKSVANLENMVIASTRTPLKIRLKQVGEVTLIPSLPVIRKYDGDLTVTVYADVKYGYSPVEIQNSLSKALSGTQKQDIRITYSGEKQKIEENFGDVGESAVLAIVLVYLILLIQFNSFRQPLVILLTIPLSIFGSVIGLTLANQPLSFTAILGAVSLLGIVVNNAIVLVDYINTERQKGKRIATACLDAVDKRFRPIMLSTTTTVIGLTPLVYSGGALFLPMAISLMSGLLVSTVMTLVVTPTVYSLLIRERGMLSDPMEDAEEKRLSIHVRS